MQKKKVNYTIIGLLFVVVAVVLFSFLFLPQINKVEAYSGAGPDANGLYYTLINGDTEYAVSDFDDSVTTVTIPSTYSGKNVTSIGNEAFYDCTSLTSITIPNSVKGIGSYAFYGCTSLTSVTIPNSLVSIGIYSFSDCTSLTSITIPSSVTSIGNGAFSNCTSLTSITIPSSVTSIGGSAFRDCTSLTSVTIPDSVTSIGHGAFRDCRRLESIIFGENSQLASIGAWGFASCSNLQSITIPNSVTSIVGYAFYGCISLTTITIPESVTSIGENAFSGCIRLTTITIPDSVTSIGDNAFKSCSSLTSIIFGENSQLTSIGNRAFYGCYSLTSITIPDSVTSIGGGAFSYCTSLTTITIPESVTSIGENAFSGCTSLTSIIFGENSLLTNIGSYAFYGCTSLTTITIPDSVTSIGDWVFKDCINLTSVIIKPILPPTIGINIFDDYINKIYVPRDSLSSYKIATNWSSYSSKIFADYYILQFLDYDDIIVSVSQNVLYNNVSVQPADPVREGFTFAGWYTNKTYSQSFVFGNAVTQDTTIYAKFTTIAKLNIEGSEIEKPLTVGNEFEDLENLRQDNIDSKPGYTLIGWIYENEPVTQETVFNYTDDITITAIFNPNTYTVTFDIDYQGESYPDPIELTYDDIIELLPNPTREGYVFKGWYIGNTKIEEGQIYNISNDSVLTALWEEIGYDYTWVYILSSILFISITLFTIFLIKNIKRKKIYRK